MLEAKKEKSFIGTLLLIVGNPGSGKDSIISGLVQNYPNNLKKIYCPKRYITRITSENENNISITQDEFILMIKNNKFALNWRMYGLYYGIPIEIDKFLKEGYHVIVNVSRSIVQKARQIYKNIKVIFIKVPLSIIIKRLKNRGREKGVDLQKRISRAKKNQDFSSADYIIDNSGDLKDAINQFLNYICIL